MGNINLNENAMLATLKVRGWNGTKHDLDATEEIHERRGADAESGRYTKRLVSRAALKPIRKIGDEARSLHYKLTMPWDDGSYRLLPVKVYDRYTKFMDDYANQRLQALQDFIDEYPQHIEAARETLGDLIDRGDYPAVAKLQARITMSHRIRTVPHSDHFVCDFLAKREIANIKRDIDRQVQSQIANAVQSLYQRVGKAVNGFVDRLQPGKDGKDKIFHESTVENLREIIELMPSLNITGDKVLTAMTAELEAALNGATASQLRRTSSDFDGGKREKVAVNMSRLHSKFAGYFAQTENLTGDVRDD